MAKVGIYLLLISKRLFRLLRIILAVLNNATFDVIQWKYDQFVWQKYLINEQIHWGVPSVR